MLALAHQISLSLSHVWLSVTPWIAARQASLSITNSQSLLKLMSFKSVMPSNHLTLSCPLHLLPSIFPSIRVFSNESVLHIRWPKKWSFSISPSNEYLGLISFRIDWFDLLAVQGPLKSLLQHHSSKASSLQCSAFFMVQLSHPYMTTGETTALTRWTFVGKVISLLFNMLSRFVIAFLPRFCDECFRKSPRLGQFQVDPANCSHSKFQDLSFCQSVPKLSHEKLCKPLTLTVSVIQ